MTATNTHPRVSPQILRLSNSRAESQNTLFFTPFFLNQLSLEITIILLKTLESVVGAQKTHIEWWLMPRKWAEERAKQIRRCGWVLFSVRTTGSLGWHPVQYCSFPGKVQNVPSAKPPVHTATTPLRSSSYRLDSFFPVLNVTSSETLPDFSEHFKWNLSPLGPVLRQHPSHS